MRNSTDILNSIASSKLIRPIAEDSVRHYYAAEDPIAWLTAHNHIIDHENLYPNLAALLGLEYIAEIPVAINNSKSLAYSIGPMVLSELMAFPYVRDGAIVIATCEPTHAERARELCQQKYPEYSNYQIAIAAPNTLRTAIANSDYAQSALNAEAYLDVANQPYSSKEVLSTGTRIFVAVVALAMIVFFFWRPPLGFLIFFAIINIFYLLFNFTRIIVTLRPFKLKSLPDLPDVAKAKPELLPMYTLLVPLKDEADMVPVLIQRLQDIDYPAERLDIKLIVEVTDTPTIHALRQEGFDGADTYASKRNLKYHLVKVPVSPLSTKPRSCNYALQFARGDMTVIYDAEDWPDPLQLKKAYALFLAEKLDTLCVQAKLNFYNDRQNLLTRFFSLEYSFWYDAFLPGLYRWGIPLPLGGTSNHFLTGTLRKIGTWDPYNVTEDADLGWRLSRLGYRTAMLDSYTLEEANSKVINWIRQRTRWQKGFLLTSLVHLRSPAKMWRQLGPWGFFSSVTLFTTTFLLPLLNPALWAFFILWYVPPLFGCSSIGFEIPDWLEFIGLINLLVGNGVYILVHLINAIRQHRYHLVLVSPLMPLYWLLISIASYRAIYQTIFRPHLWEKTKHGLK